MELKSLTEQKSLLATLPAGKRARLYRLLYEFGPGNGTLMLLPIDQGIEHGPRDFFPNPASKDPDYQFSLAAEAGYSALACQIGMAEKYYPDYAGKVPLILKVNGKTDLPSGDEGVLLLQLERRGRRAARRRRDRLHALRRLAAPGRGPRPAARRPRGMRPLRHAAGRLVLPARRSGRAQGRPGLLLRDRLRGPHGDGDGRRHRQAQHAEDQPGEGQGRPGALQRDAGRSAGGDPPVRRVGGPGAGRPLRRLQGRRRGRSSATPAR